MPGPTLSTEVIVLGIHPPKDKFLRIDAFSPELGSLVAYQRLSRKAPPLDLFDHASAELEAASQGDTWFVREARVVEKTDGLGRSYEALRHACVFARAVLSNPVPDESRAAVFRLVIQSLRSFSQGSRPEVTLLKSLFVLIRDEGYPLRQQWMPTLAEAEQTRLQHLLATPVNEQTTEAADVRRLLGKLLHYLRGHTELQLPGMEDVTW